MWLAVGAVLVVVALMARQNSKAIHAFMISKAVKMQNK